MSPFGYSFDRKRMYEHLADPSLQGMSRCMCMNCALSLHVANTAELPYFLRCCLSCFGTPLWAPRPLAAKSS